MHKHEDLTDTIWSITALLDDVHDRLDYGKIILPFVLMRRLDCLLAPTKDRVFAALEKKITARSDDEYRHAFLCQATGKKLNVYNTSRFTFATLAQADPAHLHAELADYLLGFSPNVRGILLERFRITEQLRWLDDAKRLDAVVNRFAAIDLRPEAVSNDEMGLIFDALIQRMVDRSHEIATHGTPEDVARLIVDLLFTNDHALTEPHIVRTFYDPACGSGGMLSTAVACLRERNPKAMADSYGQDIDGEAAAICWSGMLVKGQLTEWRIDKDIVDIAVGDSLTDDKHAGQKFCHMLCAPPLYFEMPFLQHMLGKMRENATGSRIGIVLSDGPFASRTAGWRGKELQRWIIEGDWLEAIIALPAGVFYATEMPTYVWIITNRKPPERRGRVQLIDASGERFWRPMGKNRALKHRAIPETARATIVRILGEMIEGGASAGVSRLVAYRDLFRLPIAAIGGFGSLLR